MEREDVLAAPCALTVVEQPFKAEDIQDLFDRTTDSAKELLRREGHLDPVILFLGKVPDSPLSEKFLYGVLHVGAFMENDDTKDVLAEVLPRILSDNGAFAVYFVSEVWFAGGEGFDVDDAYEKYGSVKEMPSSHEAVLVQLETALENEMRLFRIDRSGEHPELLEMEDKPDGTTISGRFGSFLQKVPEVMQ